MIVMNEASKVSMMQFKMNEGDAMKMLMGAHEMVCLMIMSESPAK